MTNTRWSSEFDPKNITYSDGGRCFYHGNLWPNLEIMKAKIHDKHQNIILVSGRTGTGKSELAIQMARYLDPYFNIDNIFWDTDTMLKVAASKDDIKPPGTAFIFDEAREGTQSLNAMTETNRKMGLFLDTIRSRGYHIFLLQPSYFFFQMNIATESADILIHVEKEGNDEFYQQLKEGHSFGGDREFTVSPFIRGRGRIYNADQKLKLYIKGKKMRDMNAAGFDIFTFKKSHGLIDWDEYEKRKTVAVAKLNEAFDKEVETKITPKAQRILDFKEKAYYLLNRKYGMRIKDIQEYFEEESPSNVSNYIARQINKMTKEEKQPTKKDYPIREPVEEEPLQNEEEEQEKEF